ncbi:DUF1836 domain-containing protein [Lactiplantibacillus plantarum]|nr:DUF1836 domain-containing protein [Lactiplantibacillus plantarum]MDV2575717.1 DUF1836 domain-containing protein [Lactiplantibacillus plantarum]
MEEFGSTSNYLLSWEELPAVPVYMEQLLQLVNETIQPLGLPAVTKTMINSYVKQHFSVGRLDIGIPGIRLWRY